MASVLNDDIRYVKLILLLLKGGTFVAKRLILKHLDKSIDDFLKDNEDELRCARKKRHITEKQINILFPGTRTNLECWDISLYSYILLNLFDDKLEIDDNIAITELRDKRNELLHAGFSIFSSLSEVQFSGEWTRLTLVLLQLARTLITAERKEINVIVLEISKIKDFLFARNELQPFEGSDELLHSTITEKLKSFDQKFKDIFRRLDNIERERIRNEDTRERPQEITARMTANASTPLKRDAAQAELLNATQRCVSRKQDQSDEQYQEQIVDSEVLAASNTLLSDMRDQGVDIVKVEEGSIVFTFRCSTISALINISKYLADGMYEERLAELENALSRYIESPVKLDINIVIETLYSALTQIEEEANNKAIVLTLQCRGLEGVKNAIDCFGNGSSTNALNSLSEALSTSVGQRVELHTTIDVDKLENDITELERQLIIDDQNSVHKLQRPSHNRSLGMSVKNGGMVTSLKLSTTELFPDETAPTESSQRSKHIESPMVAWTKPSTSSSSHTSPQLSKEPYYQAILYRLRPFAVRHTTGLTFTTETCEKHPRHGLHLLYAHDVEFLLEQTYFYSECEQVKGRRATLKEIESYHPEGDRLSGATSKLRHLIELPCGCFEDDPTGDYIVLEDLWTAGCVIHMAYVVGRGKLKNGIVFVPARERRFSWDSKEFQLSFAAIAAKQMKEKLNMKKILIFELNASHGLSTQKATYDDAAILYISIHDNIPWRSHLEHGGSHECGSGNAEGFNVNIALNAFARDVDYLAAFRNIFMPIARDFNPEIVLVSRKFDDEISLELCESFGYLTRELMSLASGKVVLLAEIKYHSFDERAETCLKTFLEKEITPIKEDQYRPRICTLQALERTINIQLKYWPCLQSHLSTIHTLLSEAQKEENIRQDMTAVRYNPRTALSIDTETCSKHGRRHIDSEDFDRIRLWLERDKLISDCELIRSRRATLQEIESYYFHYDVFHRPTMKLSELPCGCFEDGTTRRKIPVDALEAAGCVTDMAYRVGKGKHKNGLVFVPNSARHFEMKSDVFQLNCIDMAAGQMKEKLNMKRILIFQWNASRRMSTLKATYDDKAILHISIRDKRPWDPNPEHDCGSGNADGLNVNIVFDQQMVGRQGGAEYMAAFRNIVMPIAREFNPEIVLASGGYEVDRSWEFFGPMTSELMSLANGKVVFLLAKVHPRYSWQYKAAEMCLKALLGEEITPFKEDQLQGRLRIDALKSLERTIQIQIKYWPCLQKYLSEIQNLLADDRLGVNVLSALYEEDKKTWERGRVSSQLEGKPEPSMVSSTDERTTHNASDKYDPTVKGPRLKMEHGTKLVSASDKRTTHDASDKYDPTVKRPRLKMEHEETSSVKTKKKCDILKPRYDMP